MDHTEALKNQLTERYLLGELPGPERELFEQHYFECTDCAADVEAGLILTGNARAVWQEERPAAAPSPRLGWWDRLLGSWGAKPLFATTSLATCVLAVMCVWQASIVIPRLRLQAAAVDYAAALPTFQLAAATRGDIAQVTVPRQSRWFSLSFDIDPQVSFAGYRCDITEDGGASRIRLRAASPEPGQPISVLLPVRELPPGKYRLHLAGIRGESVTPVSEFVFQLQYK